MKVCEYGSEFDWQANEAFFGETAQDRFASAQKFRSGRDAMKAVAASVKDRYTRVLLPALCCESMVSPFTMHGFKPVFYRLHPDYTADTADVQEKMTEETILIYGSYFGIDPFHEDSLATLRRRYPKALFMEDRTQDILCVRTDRKFTPDVTIASIRKWIPIPDGGLLWGEVSVETAQNDTFATLRKDAMVKKSQYLQTGDEALKDTFRHMLGEASECLDESPVPHTMTAESGDLLEKLDFAKIYAARQENAKALMNAVTPEKGFLQLITETPEKSTLYFPILVKDQGKVQSELAKMGIYCPVIWPVPEEALGTCSVAEYTAEHMLGVPCDQRYTPEDMTYIGQQIMRIVHE